VKRSSPSRTEGIIQAKAQLNREIQLKRKRGNAERTQTLEGFSGFWMVINKMTEMIWTKHVRRYARLSEKIWKKKK